MYFSKQKLEFFEFSSILSAYFNFFEKRGMYNHKQIEKKWQKFWEEKNTFAIPSISLKPKYYVLDMFPYPSGAWLHVGHPEWYTANDIIARYKHAKGFNVLHPMGWDAFWLPAENYAIKTWTHPKITTAKNIEIFKSQIKSLWFSYDWSREVDTTDPKYYKWTQWIFAKMFEKGLAYEQDLPINFCPSCKTGLANEEVLANGTCERCGTVVEKKKIRQWVLAITKYADRLADDLEYVDWSEGIKDMQRKWIGKSEGCEFEMKKFDDPSKSIRVYTTRIDTVFGMTYAVIAPDHADIQDFITEAQRAECEAYILTAKNKSDLERTGTKEKTWVFTWSYVINPFNGEKVPLYIWDYVLGNYGTGAVMAVPAHDERDFKFARKFGIEVKPVIWLKELEWADWVEWETHIVEEINWNLVFIPTQNHNDFPITQDGILVYSGEFSWLDSKTAREKLIQYATEKWFWEKRVNYKLRDWLFSRQRYWGEPIPLIHLAPEDVRSLKRIYSLDECPNDGNAYVLKTDPENLHQEENIWEFFAAELASLKQASLQNSANISSDHLDSRTLCSKWQIKDLVINGKIVSRIYSGLYSDIIIDWKLPLELPQTESFEPSGDGNSPLAGIESFVNIELAPNLKGKRETNTMPQWWGSCWYYLRYMDPNNVNHLVDPEIEKYWGSVDSYVGWAEHAVLHLLYARFWHKFLYDIGVVSTKEPFYRLRNQGMILAYAYENEVWALIPVDEVVEKDEKYYHKNTGEALKQVVAKMSKSLKNVINPNDIVDEYGADALRLYEMSMADFKDSKPWDTKNIMWVARFLDKVWNIFENGKEWNDDKEAMKHLHKTIKKVSDDIENYKFNTAISQMMILVNYGTPKDEHLQKEWKEKFLLLLHPFAPHIAEELWQQLGNTKTIYDASWPEYDEAMTIDDEVVIWVQVLWKLRWELAININENKDIILQKARELESVAKWLEWKEIIKEIYVPGKIVNIVTR